jgi:hypothetical protein
MTTVQRQSSPRGRWVIPAILVAVIVLVILGAMFGSRIKNAMSASATATPRQIVVTATPAPGTQVAANGPAATPGSAGGSTPLPGATPLPTVPGIHIGMVTRPQSHVTQIQTGATNGDPTYTFYLDPTKTLNKTLPAEGFTQGFTVVKPTTANPTPTPYTGPDGRPLVKYYVRYQSQIYTVQVVQPGTRGPKGIWVIATIFQGHQ